MVGMAPVDLGDSASARAWEDQAARAFGQVDVLFNNAAAPRFAPIHDLTDGDWHLTIRNEFDLVFYVTQAAWPHLVSSRGVIVNTASIQGVVGIENGGLAHAAAKGGIIAMSRQMAAEGAKHGVRANSVIPGTIETASNAHVFEDRDTRMAIESAIQVGRIGRPEDVAPLALYLASDESSCVTGANFVFPHWHGRDASCDHPRKVSLSQRCQSPNLDQTNSRGLDLVGIPNSS
jgi:meso-butanediol dehydrogenase/(S,S)-butanediol dehydrogenase/diacetyl reductase